MEDAAQRSLVVLRESVRKLLIEYPNITEEDVGNVKSSLGNVRRYALHSTEQEQQQQQQPSATGDVETKSIADELWPILNKYAPEIRTFVGERNWMRHLEKNSLLAIRVFLEESEREELFQNPALYRFATIDLVLSELHQQYGCDISSIVDSDSGQEVICIRSSLNVKALFRFSASFRKRQVCDFLVVLESSESDNAMDSSLAMFQNITAELRSYRLSLFSTSSRSSSDYGELKSYLLVSRLIQYL